MSSDSEESDHDENIAKLIPSAINYKTRQVEVNTLTEVLDVSSVEGLTFSWSGHLNETRRIVFFIFDLDWAGVTSDVVSMKGNFKIKYRSINPESTLKPGDFNIDMTVKRGDARVYKTFPGLWCYDLKCKMSYSASLTRSPVIKNSDVEPTKALSAPVQNREKKSSAVEMTSLDDPALTDFLNKEAGRILAHFPKGLSKKTKQVIIDGLSMRLGLRIKTGNDTKRFSVSQLADGVKINGTRWGGFFNSGGGLVTCLACAGAAFYGKRICEGIIFVVGFVLYFLSGVLYMFPNIFKFFE